MNTHAMHRKLYEHVEEAIGLRIIKGDYRPGETLPNEEALCTAFGVSRGVIREAVKVLHKKGLVRPRPKIGTQIQPRTRWNLFDADVLVWKLAAGEQLQFLSKVTEVRTMIESEAARLSAARATTAEIDTIRKCCRQLEALLASETGFRYETYLEYDMAFHTAVLEASHNELLAQIGRTMRQAVQVARQADVRDIHALRESQPFHRAVMEAVAQQDPQRAYAASRDLFAQVWRHLPG